MNNLVDLALKNRDVKPKHDHSLLLLTDMFPEAKELIEATEEANLWVNATVFSAHDSMRKVEVLTQHRDNQLTDLNGNKFPKKWLQKVDDAFKHGLKLYMDFMELQTYGYNSLISEGYQMLKYQPGNFYKKHIDGWTAKYRVVSAVLYLNDNFEDGFTGFPKQYTKIKPQTGTMLFFPSNYSYPHEALPPKNGTKYCIVTWYKLAY